MNPQYIRAVSFDNELDVNSYLNDLPVIRYLAENSISFDRPVTFLVGENGTGKSTLLEAIAIAYGFNAEGGTKNFRFSTNDTHSELYRHITLSRRSFASDGFFLRAESLYNVATNIDDMDGAPSFSPPVIESYGGVSLHEQSHGESFLAIVHNRFSGNGLYILDEPEAALSPMRILSLMVEINRLVQKNSQLIISTNSPILMSFPDGGILELSENGVNAVNYRDTEHYKITKDFLNDPERILHYLLEE
ncbi:MAG: AAA family ATPase [Ruminococcus sp.]|nr:AAA family ATPase [Candidatus Apopatosoma intestinale]